MRRTFSSLRYRNYRLFFFGQAVSQTGSWMQRIALSWFVLQLTHSAFAVGVLNFATFVPILLFSVTGGVLMLGYMNREALRQTLGQHLPPSVASSEQPAELSVPTAMPSSP